MEIIRLGGTDATRAACVLLHFLKFANLSDEKKIINTIVAAYARSSRRVDLVKRDYCTRVTVPQCFASFNLFRIERFPIASDLSLRVRNETQIFLFYRFIFHNI